MPYHLPYQIRMFYAVSRMYTYALTYVVQLPFVFISTLGHIGPDFLVVTLMLHVFGQSSVLVKRIDKITTDNLECGPAILKLVEKHVRLICVLLYILSVVLLIYLYCFVGECLIHESTRVHNAFSECGWHKMPSRFAKLIVICTAKSQQPLVTTYGKFYTFTMRNCADSDRLPAVDVVNWNRRILGFVGCWPEDSKYSRFSFFLGYLVIHNVCECTYLFKNIRKLEDIISSLTEVIPFTAAILKSILIQKHKNILCKIIHHVEKNSNAGGNRSDEEVRVFNEYILIAKNFIRVVPPMIFLTSLIYFAKPLVSQLADTSRNETNAFVLPYHVSLFYDIADTSIYALTYALQAPLVLIVTLSCLGPDCLMVTLTVHVCGELSVLAIQIKNVQCNIRRCHEDIRILINKHVRLIEMAGILEDAFNLLLLGQLFGATFLICFLGYSVLANATEGQETDLLNFALYGFLVVVLLYVYCYIGDCLTNENGEVRNAFFHSSWYELPVEDSKLFVTCMIQCQKPLHLTAGKFYVFSLEKFADVMKTSMAYLSVLRTLL